MVSNLRFPFLTARNAELTPWPSRFYSLTLILAFQFFREFSFYYAWNSLSLVVSGPATESFLIRIDAFLAGASACFVEASSKTLTRSTCSLETATCSNVVPFEATGGFKLRV